MRIRILAGAVLAVAVAASLTGCVVLSGPSTTQERDIEAATVVELRTGGDLVITIGDPSLTITAGQNVIDRLTSEVRDGVLILDAPGPLFGGFGDIDYALTLPDLSEVRIQGSGDVDVDFADADDVRVSIAGSGDIETRNVDAQSVTARIEGSGEIDLVGLTNDLEVSIDGSGDVNAYDLKARTASVSISGSGEVDVLVVETLDVSISGSGTVRHKGGATVNSSISGSGDVIDEQ